MKYKILGNSSLKVSEVCLGTMTFGEEFGIGAQEAESRSMYDAFLAAGGNFIDTANIYNYGTSEKMLSRFIADQRDYLVLASKYSLSTRSDDPNAGGSHRKNLVQSLEASLRRLKTDYIDLFWVHGWDTTTSLPELMRALDDQIRAGKILHIGISNAPAWVVATANTLAKERGQTGFCALQLHYNLVERSVEREFFQLADAQDMAITAWSPLAGGLLSGKYGQKGDSADKPAGRLHESSRRAKVLGEKNLGVAESLSALARDIGCSPSQLALAWIAQRSATNLIPIVGARSVEQLKDNLGSIDIKLTKKQIEALDLLTALTPEYPQSLLGSEFFQVLMYGEHGKQER